MAGGGHKEAHADSRFMPLLLGAFPILECLLCWILVNSPQPLSYVRPLLLPLTVTHRTPELPRPSDTKFSCSLFSTFVTRCLNRATTMGPATKGEVENHGVYFTPLEGINAADRLRT